MLPETLVFGIALLITGVILFLLIYFVSFSKINISNNALLFDVSSMKVYNFLSLTMFYLGNNPFRPGVWLSQCPTVLFQVEFLGRTEAVGPLLSGVYPTNEWELVSVHRQSADDRMASVRPRKSSLRKSGNLRSGRNSQPWHGEKAHAGHNDWAGILHDNILRVSVLVWLDGIDCVSTGMI